MKKLLFLTMLLVSFNAAANNYWLFDLTRVANQEQEFLVTGEVLISNDEYLIQGVICSESQELCIPVRERAEVAFVNHDKTFAILDFPWGYSLRVPLFAHGDEHIAVFDGYVVEYKHVGDFEEIPELEHGHNNAMSLGSAVEELRDH